jgi:hypothetical protein
LRGNNDRHASAALQRAPSSQLRLHRSSQCLQLTVPASCPDMRLWGRLRCTVGLLSLPHSTVGHLATERDGNCQQTQTQTQTQTRSCTRVLRVSSESLCCSGLGEKDEAYVALTSGGSNTASSWLLCFCSDVRSPHPRPAPMERSQPQT